MAALPSGRGGATRHDESPEESELPKVAASETRSSDLASTQRAHALVGTTLRGKYHLDGVIGVGGVGAVYAATHRNSKRFAVKMLHGHLSLNDDIRGRFLREGYAANQVGHSGTVAVLDDDVTEDGAAFLVMELLEGFPVDVLAERCGGRLSVTAAVAIVDQLLEVLAAAHANNIIHRDIKPANLFVTGGRLKVLDFGIARARDVLSSGGGKSTNTGTLLGTPAFMAPEQARAQSSEMGPQTDLWAAAATLFTLVTGELVHPGDNPTLMLVHAATRSARPMTALPFGVSAQLAAVVDRGLAFAKGDRWPTATAMREALRAAYLAEFGTFPARIVIDESLALAPSLTPAPLTSSPLGEARRGSRRWPLIALLALFFGAAWLVLAFGRRSRPSPKGVESKLASIGVAAPVVASTHPAEPADSSSSAAGAAADGKKPSSNTDALHAGAPRVTATMQARPAPAHITNPVSCFPPYHFDSQGNQVFNKECL